LHITASAYRVSKTALNRMKKVESGRNIYTLVFHWLKEKLKLELERNKLDTTGTKAELVDRIWTYVNSKVATCSIQ